MAKPRLIDWPTLRKVAAPYDVDPRSLDKLLRGKPVRGSAGHRARAALLAAGFGSLLEAASGEERQS